MAREELRRMLRKMSYEKREVILASGKTSDFYIDAKKTFMTPLGMDYCAGALLWMLGHAVSEGDWAPCEFVAGTGVGGGSLAIGLMMRARLEGLRIQALYVRDTKKDHGIQSRIVPNWPPGNAPDSVVVVEDVLTTGASALSACRALVDAGFLVQGVLALVDREEGGMENLKKEGFDSRVLFVKTELIEE